MYFTIYGIILTIIGLTTIITNKEKRTGYPGIKEQFKEQDYWLTMRFGIWLTEALLATFYLVFFILALDPTQTSIKTLVYVAIFFILYEATLIITRWFATKNSPNIDTFIGKTIISEKRFLWVERLEKLFIIVFIVASLN